MKVLIVEDETAAYKNLKNVLAEIDPGIEVLGNTEGVSQTVKWLQNQAVQPDLIFMDIHLSDGSAFNIFNTITVEIPVIFTTAYDEYAIDAFKVNSIDYLLKPIEVKEVQRALDKFSRLNRQDVLHYLTQLPQLIPPGRYARRILIAVNDKLIPVEVGDIACFYTTEEKTAVLLKDGRTLPYNKTLDNIMQLLDPADFFRANKQFIIPKACISDITIWFDSRLLISLQIEVPERIYVSKNKAAEFKRWLTS